MDKYIEYAPLLLVVLMFFIQNNLFVKPEKLEEKHRKILEDVDKKLKEDRKNFVELNAYKEFQSRVLDGISDVNKNVNELKDFLMDNRKV